MIVLLGILSVFVLPRFTGTGTFAEYATRDQIIAALRFAQQRAMYDHGATSCYRLRLDAAGQRFGPQRSTDSGASFSYFGPAEWQSGQAMESAVTPPGGTPDIYFDGLGNSVDDCSAGAALRAASIGVSGEVSLSICVETTGYAHAC